MKLYYFPPYNKKQVYVIGVKDTIEKVFKETFKWKGVKLIYIDCKSLPDPMESFDPSI